MTKHKVITFAPITVLATLIAISLQLNGMLMMWKIQQTKKDGTELIRRTHPSFISVTTTTMLGGPCHIACYAGYFFSSQAARGQWAHVFEISPFALREKKTRKNKQTNKNKGVSQQFSDLIDSCGTRTIGPGYLKSLWQLSPLVPICNGLKQEGIGREIIHFAGPKTFSQKLCFPRFYCLPRQSILVFFTA